MRRRNAVVLTVGLLVVALIAVAIFSRTRAGEARIVRLDDMVVVPQAQPTPSNILRIAIGGMTTPQSGLEYYHRLLQYVGGKIGRPIQCVDRASYAEINASIKDGRIDGGFVCSGPYVDGKKDFGLELLAMPQIQGQTVYYAYIIVPVASSATSLADLQGKVFAFTDPLSNTGKVAPCYMLSKLGQNPESFFKQVVYTRSHDRSIQAVAEGMVDGASVDSLIWDQISQSHPEWTSAAKVIEKSAAYGIPPFVISPNLDRDTARRLADAILSAHTDPQGQAILKNMNIDRFVPGDDRAYDSIRQMQAWLETQQGQLIPAK
jgi:phosphonate transport system substrate-binding protein